MRDEYVVEFAKSDWDAIHLATSAAFNADVDAEVSVVERALFEPERCLVARRGDGHVVGTAGVATRTMTVPGAVVPAGHVTLVAVAATARRQGIMAKFMRQQFRDIGAAGEPIAVLWATEGRIYQRFGYGLAARKLRLNIESREVRVPVDHVPGAAAGRLREGTPAELREVLMKVYQHVCVERPGWSGRGQRDWDHRLADPGAWRRGSGALRAVVHEGERGADGYALWRVENTWHDSGPAGKVKVVEHVASTPAAYAALWHFLLTMDLTRSATHSFCSMDEPLLFLVDEPRRLGPNVADALWLRIVDLPAALAARRYQADVDVVLEVVDELVPTNAGRWRLIGSPSAARCESTVDSPDLICDVRCLGAAYLGGTPLTALADGGLVREVRPGSLQAAATAFGWHRSPTSIEVF